MDTSELAESLASNLFENGYKRSPELGKVRRIVFMQSDDANLENIGCGLDKKALILLIKTEMEKLLDVYVALNILSKNIKEDPEYAHSWHANIASMCHDAIVSGGVHSSPEAIANDVASRFMKLWFDIETSQNMLIDQANNNV